MPIINKRENIKGLKNKFNEIYFKAIENVRKSKEYQNNQLKINSIKDMITENSDIPTDILDIFIETIVENVAIEYDYANDVFIRYLNGEEKSKQNNNNVISIENYFIRRGVK